MNKLTDSQIDKAVEWWGSRVNSPRFDNGDRENGGFAAALALMMKKTATDEQIAKFKEVLRETLHRENPSFIGVDYDPDWILSDALTAAGLPCGKSALPWKTDMSFYDGKVEVSEGYGAERVELKGE